MFYKQNIINVKDNIIIETTLLSLPHAEELENKLAKQPAHLAAPILSQIHIICATSSLELKLHDIQDDVLRPSCQYLQRCIRSLEIQLLPDTFSSTVASTPSTSISTPALARENSQLLPISPPTTIYKRKTRREATVHGVTKAKSSKGKKCEVIDLTSDPTTSTITVKQPDLSTNNFVVQHLVCYTCGTMANVKHGKVAGVRAGMKRQLIAKGAGKCGCKAAAARVVQMIDNGNRCKVERTEPTRYRVRYVKLYDNEWMLLDGAKYQLMKHGCACGNMAANVRESEADARGSRESCAWYSKPLQGCKDFQSYIGHRHKNCPKYHCRVCQAHMLGHFSIYCPYAPKKEHFLLVYTNKGFYNALAE
ncbi:hypothetical protein C8R48DRAFT_669547 [Suillus tomentosus]|nr:hypothetical protein C8R48DRAFT_669547 [Suillus tomentosus]